MRPTQVMTVLSPQQQMKVGGIPAEAIGPPAICAPTSATKPTRMATRWLMGTLGLLRNEAIVSVTMTTMSASPPNASVRAIQLSIDVSRLKCDGTPRQV
jgi:hypothetical protein